MNNDYLAEIAAKLTWNGAFNLRSTVTNPCSLNSDAVHGKGRMFLGLGKWTTLGVIGVENHLKKLGLAREVLRDRPEHYTGRDKYRTIITPLGREMAVYLNEHWDDLRDGFREGSRR